VAETEGISECFDRCACGKARRGRAGKVRGVSKVLLSLLEEQRLAGATVLELGCGLGGLTRETVSRGASRATGIDLSPVSIREASRLAAETGLADRVEFAVGDGARVELAPHDVVVLDKVICCYPEVDALLSNSLGGARRTYAFVAPVSWGWRGVVANVGIGFVNAFLRIGRQKYRAFVHDLGRVEARVAEAGFDRVAATSRAIWFVGVYRRPTSAAASVLARDAFAQEPGGG
jgi:SAM-dependent methyltransferase